MLIKSQTGYKQPQLFLQGQNPDEPCVCGGPGLRCPPEGRTAVFPRAIRDRTARVEPNPGLKADPPVFKVFPHPFSHAHFGLVPVTLGTGYNLNFGDNTNIETTARSHPTLSSVPGQGLVGGAIWGAHIPATVLGLNPISASKSSISAHIHLRKKQVIAQVLGQLSST